MAPRNKHYLALALSVNCFVLIALILNSQLLSTLDVKIGLLPATWDAPWSKTSQAAVDRGPKKRHCDMCTANSTLCEELGEPKLNQAIWNRGSETRIRRFLAKAKRGEGFTVGVIGGSVSFGHGLNRQPLKPWQERTTPLNMNRAIFDHLDSLFPAPGGQVIGEAGGNGKNGFVNGAQGGQGTGYFSMCFGEHIPEEVDLVLVDLSINDELLMNNMDSYELMVRGLMDLPNKPAILNIHIFALMFRSLAWGGDLHSGVSQFYGVPTISLRGPFLYDILADINLVKEFFAATNNDHENDFPTIQNIDTRHLSVKGHRRVAELVNAYINWQICEMDDLPIDNLDEIYPISPLPRQLLVQKYDPGIVVPPLKPMCMSTNGLKHKLVPQENEGWEDWNWKEKNYLRASKPHSKVAFKFTTSLGTVQLHYLRSAIFGLGSIQCWVDNEKEKAVTVVGYWPEKYNIGRGVTIRSDLASGDHILRCELLEATADPGGGTEFRMISVMSI